MGAVFSDKASLQNALTEWQNDQTAAGETHGPISAWDVSAVTDMSELFRDDTVFNSDINAWDVSNTTNMGNMFFVHPNLNQATAYNQPMDAWQVGQVASFNQMFSGSTAFNQDVSGWNISGAAQMGVMFHRTPIAECNTMALDTSACHNLALHNSFKAQNLAWRYTFTFRSYLDDAINEWSTSATSVNIEVPSPSALHSARIVHSIVHCIP